MSSFNDRCGYTKESSREEEERREEEGTFALEDRGLPLDREEIGLAHGQMLIYKGKGGNPVLGCVGFVLIGYVNEVSQKRAFDCWISILR